jgi:membrane-associated phospholipid phosphatase
MMASRVLKWWPPIGLVAMVVLGLAVGRGPTPFDDWFIREGQVHEGVYRLLLFTKPSLLAVMLLAAVAGALFQRRWRLAAVVVLTPVIAVATARLLKPLFEREKQGGLAYPSGHVTVLVAVLGMVVLVAGARVWMLVAAAVFALLGLVGQGLTHHYFTDTIGAALLGTALVCLAIRVAELDRCQPRCDLHHSGG